LIDHYRRLFDFAGDTNYRAAKNGRIGGLQRLGLCCAHDRILRILACTEPARLETILLRGLRAGLCRGTELRARIRSLGYLPEKLTGQSCDVARQLPRECSGNGHLLQVVEVHAAHELSGWSNVNQPPASVGAVHRFAIGLA